MEPELFTDLRQLAQHLRNELQEKQFVLLYAYNGTGKTRLSTAFKDIGKQTDDDGEVAARDTLYFNAFTEDLFQWDNDLNNDSTRVLKINSTSHFFDGLAELEMETRIRPLLNRYADFDFHIDIDQWAVSFSRGVPTPKGFRTEDDIKISRGEERIFVWCFFLAIVQLVLDGAEAYGWVKYVYIDDPMSSMDNNNVIAVAHHLTQLLTTANDGPKVVISTHHVLYFNVLCNSFRKKAYRYFLRHGATRQDFALVDTSATPFLHHLATLAELHNAQTSGRLYTYHFNMLRRVMEQTAGFFGLNKWEDCIPVTENDPDGTFRKRLIDLMSHGDYALYEPHEMMDENKQHFRRIFDGFIHAYPFEPKLFQSITVDKTA